MPNPTQPWRRYVALGDSLTEGLEDHRPDGSPRGWADRLAQQLADRADTEISYANLAIRGRLLGPILAEQVEPALRLSPDLVSIWGGGNDLLRPGADPDGLAADLEDAVERFRAIGADVLLGTGIDCKGSPILEATRPKTAIYIANVWTIAARHGAHVLNTWGMRSLRDWRLWHPDRLHLNAEGHERVTQAALVALGLPPERPDWDTPLPPAAPLSRREELAWNAAWLREHVAPWIGRRIRGISSGAGRTPKHPTWVTVFPASATSAASATAQ